MTDFSDPADVLNFIKSYDFQYNRGAIFPCEMALFLYRCSQTGVDCIIESGRGEGYSTAIIAAYAAEKNIRVISSDFESDRQLALRCRERLERFPNLELLTGDSFDNLPSTLRGIRSSAVALLIDGPKYDDAICFSAACAAIGPVRLIAHHNTEPQVPWYQHFMRRFPRAHHFEDSELCLSSAFPDFRRWEETVANNVPKRSITNTSLILSVLPRSGPDLSYIRDISARYALTTALYYGWWKLGFNGNPLTKLRMSRFGRLWRRAYRRIVGPAVSNR
jgi:predicted O-methyltransferase YrrM